MASEWQCPHCGHINKSPSFLQSQGIEKCSACGKQLVTVFQQVDEYYIPKSKKEKEK